MNRPGILTSVNPHFHWPHRSKLALWQPALMQCCQNTLNSLNIGKSDQIILYHSILYRCISGTLNLIGWSVGPRKFGRWFLMHIWPKPSHFAERLTLKAFTRVVKAVAAWRERKSRTHLTPFLTYSQSKSICHVITGQEMWISHNFCILFIKCRFAPKIWPDANEHVRTIFK